MSSKEHRIRFFCPNCRKEAGIQEVMVDMIVTSDIVVIEWPDGSTPAVSREYGEQTNEDGHVARYICKDCGYCIVDDMSPHADEGVDEYALVMAIRALNKVKLCREISFDELVERFSKKCGGMGGGQLADFWNEMMPDDPCSYEGDSIFKVKE